MFVKTVPLVLLVGAAAFVTSSNVHDTRAAKIPVVTVHSKDFSFDAPKTIPAGMTSFKLVNDGKEIHHATIIKLEQGKTVADLQTAMKNSGQVPSWLVPVGGPNAAMPGESVEATLNLEAGSYVILCFVPSMADGAPHFSKGMVHPFAVSAASGITQAGAASIAAPTPEVHLVIKDYGFVFSKPPHAGKNVIHVMNEGPQQHEVIFFKLSPGKHISDFNAWAGGGMKGPPPAVLIDGMAPMANGRTGIFTANLAPGTYALTCYVSDAKDNKEHSAHGMNLEFTVK